MSTKKSYFSFIFSDSSLWAIIIGNVFSILMADVQGWPIGEVMWIYWGQSVIIGILNVVRMLGLKDFTTNGLTMNNQPVPETQAAKRGVAMFFAFHYGIFHLVYALLLWAEFPLTKLSADDLVLLVICIGGFFAAHGYSLRRNASVDFKQKQPNLGTLMAYPYLRIIPMHLTMLFGGIMNGSIVMLIFMILKTFADAGMHAVEHHIFQKPEKST